MPSNLHAKARYLPHSARQAVVDEPAIDATGVLSKSLEAIQDNCNSDRTEILDARISAYLKLKKPELALKDAKSMIRHNRADAKGYIRCGQIESLLGNDAAARSWYEHGLKKVPASDRLYTAMESRLARVNSQIAQKTMQAKAADPMLLLPLEVVELILSYLDYRTLTVLLRVSRPWNRMLSKLSPLTDTIDYSEARRLVNYDMNKAVLKRLQQPKTMVIGKVTRPAWKSISQRWPSFNTLETLKLDMSQHPEGIEAVFNTTFNLKSLKRIFVGSELPVTLSFVSNTLHECPGLDTARFRHVKALSHRELQEIRTRPPENKLLRDLEIVGSHAISTVLPDGFLKGLTALQTLRCQRTSFISESGLDLGHMQHLREVSFVDSAVHYPALFHSSAQKIVLEKARYLDSLTAPSRSFSLRNIRVLSIYECDKASLMYAPEIADPECLTELAVSFAVDDSMYARFLHRRWLGNLQRLRIRAPSLCDAHTSIFAEECTKLEILDIEEAAISAIFIADLINAPTSRLRRVTAVNCTRVGSDIVDYAARKGVVVQLMNGYSEAGERRVRWES